MTPQTLTPSPAIISRHHTADGILTWERNASGQLQAMLRPYGAETGDGQVVAQSRPR